MAFQTLGGPFEALRQKTYADMFPQQAQTATLEERQAGGGGGGGGVAGSGEFDPDPHRAWRERQAANPPAVVPPVAVAPEAADPAASGAVTSGAQMGSESPSMMALGMLGGGDPASEGHGVEPQTPLEMGLGARSIAASSRALLQLAAQQGGRVY